jgi:signal transduction histidine kinase
VVSGLVDDAVPVAKHKGIQLSCRTEAPGLLVPLDRGKFEKIALNLLGNALKFTPPGGRIDVKLSSSDTEFQLSVADTGPGIAPEKRAVIFRRFEQIDSSLTRSYQGSGIGLATVKEFVELMGGRVELESEVGRGSVFRVHLPRNVDLVREAAVSANAAEETHRVARFGRLSELFEVAKPPRATPSPEGSEQAAAAKPRVLLADDSADMRDYMRDILEDAYDVEAVENGEQALEALQRREPVVIVSDVMMPKMNGLELIARLHDDPVRRHIPVILVTARASREEVVGGLDAGADDYLSKPFGPSELRARVHAAHRHRQLSERLEAKNRELEQTLDKLRDTQDELVQAGKMAAVGTLVAGMSHELNNPIAGILMTAESLRRRTPKEAPGHEAIDAIIRQAERSGRLVKLLLEFSRRKPIATERLAIDALIARVAELASSQVHGADLALTVRPSEPGLPPVEASVQEMEVALLNLIKNGIDATAGTHGSVSITAERKERSGAVGVEISVSDTGPGIAPEVLPRIFEPFFTTKAVGMGTGLGLALTKRIIESQGGQIHPETCVGSGTTMRVWLPPAQGR